MGIFVVHQPKHMAKDEHIQEVSPHLLLVTLPALEPGMKHRPLQSTVHLSSQVTALVAPQNSPEAHEKKGKNTFYISKNWKDIWKHFNFKKRFSV